MGTPTPRQATRKFKVIDLVGFRETNCTNACSSRIFAWQSDAKFDPVDFMETVHRSFPEEEAKERGIAVDIVKCLEKKDVEAMRPLVISLFCSRYKIVSGNALDEDIAPLILEVGDMSEVGLFALSHSIVCELLDRNIREAAERLGSLARENEKREGEEALSAAVAASARAFSTAGGADSGGRCRVGH